MTQYKIGYVGTTRLRHLLRLDGMFWSPVCHRDWKGSIGTTSAPLSLLSLGCQRCRKFWLGHANGTALPVQ